MDDDQYDDQAKDGHAGDIEEIIAIGPDHIGILKQGRIHETELIPSFLQGVFI